MQKPAIELEQTNILNRSLMRLVGLLSFIAIVGLVLGLMIASFDLPIRVRNQLRMGSETLAGSMEIFLRSVGHDLIATAGSVGFVEDPPVGLLRRARDRQAAVTKLMIVDNDGLVLVESAEAGAVSSVGQYIDWLAGFEIDALYTGEIFFEADGEVALNMVAPIWDDELRQRGYLLATVQLDDALQASLNALDLHLDGYAYFVDGDGQMLSDRDDGIARDSEINRFARRTNSTLPAIDHSAAVYNGIDGLVVVGRAVSVDMVGWYAIVEAPLAGLLTGLALPIFIFFVTFALLDVGLYMIFRFIRRQIASPLAAFRSAIESLRQDDFSTRVEIDTGTELDVLAEMLNKMAARLQDLLANLDRRVAERTRRLQAVSELGRLLTGQRDLNILLPYAVQVIQRHTDFYHVQIFLLDEEREYAVLRASTGEAGQMLLDAGHRLAVGSESVIGRVAESGQPVIALDTADAIVPHQPNPLLPNTRSEMALPLWVGNRLIGALDVQSMVPNAFGQQEVDLFQALADQLASAIDNARQIQEIEEDLREARQLNRVLMGEAYSEVVQLRRTDTLGYTSYGADVRDDPEWTDMLRRAVLNGASVKEAEDGRYLSLPITTRGGAVVGAFEFELDREQWREDLPELAESLLDRVAASLETARVFEQAQRFASRERQVNDVTARLQEETEIEDLIEVAAEEIRRALRARRTAIRVDLGS